MHKRKNKCKKINNLRKPNFEIDSNKLSEIIAEAIKKAQNSPTIEETDLDDEELFVDKVVSGKIPKGKVFSSTLSKLMESFFYILAIASILFTALFVILVVISILKNGWNNGTVIFENVYHICGAILLVILDVFFVRIVRRIASEIGQEQDKNYIVSAFSCIVSLVALIVALVALFKGVG